MRGVNVLRMSAQEIDDYLDAVDDPTARATLEELRAIILDLMPEAEEGIAYGVPVFRLDGTPIAGFAAFTHHLTYLPHSGSVLARLGDATNGYRVSKGALQFPQDTCLPAGLVQLLVEYRREEVDA